MELVPADLHTHLDRTWFQVLSRTACALDSVLASKNEIIGLSGHRILADEQRGGIYLSATVIFGPPGSGAAFKFPRSTEYF